MKNKRIEWADTLKAIGIFFVVLGHNVLPAEMYKYIFSFHVPLFFFISGYLFFPEKFRNFSDF